MVCQPRQTRSSCSELGKAAGKEPIPHPPEKNIHHSKRSLCSHWSIHCYLLLQQPFVNNTDKRLAKYPSWKTIWFACSSNKAHFSVCCWVRGGVLTLKGHKHHKIHPNLGGWGSTSFHVIWPKNPQQIAHFSWENKRPSHLFILNY